MPRGADNRQIGGSRLRTLGVAASDDHVGACLGQRPRKPLSQVARAAGHERGPTTQVE